jgi:hypothetical protein
MYKHELNRATTWSLPMFLQRLTLTFFKWFAHMSEGLGEDTFFPQFLSFIQNFMLHPDRKKRVDCKDVELFLERCLGNDVESSYWLFDGKLTEKYSLSRSSTNSSSWSSD